MTDEQRDHLQLPEMVPGTVEELSELAAMVIGGKRNGRGHLVQEHKERVAQELHDLACIILDQMKQQEQSPPAKVLEAQLHRIIRLTQELSEVIDSLPYFMLELLDTVYHAQRGWDQANRTFVNLGLGSASVKVAVLAIHEAALQHAESWRGGTVVGRVPPDRSGPQRAFQRFIGDPRFFLACQVAQLIRREQGKAAVTTDVKGAVYQVVVGLWTYATGQSENGANLRQYVRNGIRYIRNFRDI